MRIFRADPMVLTPFAGDDPAPEFRRGGMRYVSEPDAADIILACRLRHLWRYRRRRCRLAVWTDEPRWDVHTASPVRVRGFTPPVHIMNAYTGGIFTDNYLFMKNMPAVDFDASMRAFAGKPWRAVMLATYRKRRDGAWSRIKRTLVGIIPHQRFAAHEYSPLRIGGRDIDLLQARQSLALHLQERGFCDIYGRGWPPDVRLRGESRLGAWREAKNAILENYGVNVALENTDISHYVSEKIWDAVREACLPVYHGASNGIYDDFPKGSFVEAAGRSAREIADEIMAMPPDERSGRYEACLRTYLRIIAEGRPQRAEAACRERAAGFIQGIMDGAPVA